MLTFAKQKRIKLLDIIYWLIPLSLIILAVAIGIFFWAVQSGQFKDLDSPAVELLFDKDPLIHSKKNNTINADKTKK